MKGQRLANLTLGASHSIGSDGAASTVGGVDFLLWAALIAIAAALVLVAVLVRRQHLVAGASVALERLAAVNATYRPMLTRQPPIHFSFVESVNSKSKYDRFDLVAFMTRCVLEQESQIQRDVDSRWAAVEQFQNYEREVDSVFRRTLGVSSHQRLTQDVFNSTERRMFERQRFRSDPPSARLRATVTYTSAKGQNSYARSLDWGFDQLRAGLREAQERRARQSTTQFLRQRERALVTDRVRMQIFRRDDFRCRMCGASGREGAELHVDHIVPVSRGGRSGLENLQALCKACNLGKGNTFVG